MTDTKHRVPSTAEIVSTLSLEYMEQDKLAYQPGFGPNTREALTQVAAHAQAEQIALTLSAITGQREWDANVHKHRRDGNRKQYAIYLLAREVHTAPVEVAIIPKVDLATDTLAALS